MTLSTPPDAHTLMMFLHQPDVVEGARTAAFDVRVAVPHAGHDGPCVHGLDRRVVDRGTGTPARVRDDGAVDDDDTVAYGGAATRDQHIGFDALKRTHRGLAITGSVSRLGCAGP